MLNATQTATYLQRIGFSGDVRTDKETLDKLVFCQQTSIPFSTYSIRIQKKTPSLALDDLYTKIIEDGLGGYCFELNKLFEALLAALGFTVRPCLCRTIGEDGKRSPLSHRGVLVTLENGVHYADVGFGGQTPIGAVKIEEGLEQPIGAQTFTFRLFSENWWTLDQKLWESKASGEDNPEIDPACTNKAEDAEQNDENLSETQWRSLLEICTVEADDIDFEPLSIAFSQPTAFFGEHLIADVKTPTGKKSLMDETLTLREGSEKTVRQLTSQEEIESVLAEYFGIKGK